MKKDYTKHLAAVNAALAEEMKQKRPNEATIQACAFFKTVCDKNARDFAQYNAQANISRPTIFTEEGVEIRPWWIDL